MTFGEPDITGGSAFAATQEWIAALLTGTLASSIGAIAIAGVGFAMLAGRLSWRDAARVVLGCCVLVGARTLSTGLFGLVRGAQPDIVVHGEVAPGKPMPPSSGRSQGFDPYAGASVPN